MARNYFIDSIPLDLFVKRMEIKAKEIISKNHVVRELHASGPSAMRGFSFRQPKQPEFRLFGEHLRELIAAFS